VSAIKYWSVQVEKITSLVSFDHQLIDCFQLGVVELADLVGLDVRHVERARVLEVLEGLGNEEAQDFQVSSLDGIKNL
jgi:hypothetical protein